MNAVEPLALKLPYSQQFSPGQTPLKKLIGVLRSNAKTKRFKEGIAAAFFKGKSDPIRLAANTLIALRSWGILEDSNDLTEFGKKLLSAQGDDHKAHQLLARQFLRELGGIVLVETLREMKSAALPIKLDTLPGELRARSVAGSDNSSDLSSMCEWLRRAGVLSGRYDVHQETYEKLAGTTTRTLDAMRGLEPGQIAFLRAILAMNVKDWTPYNDVARYAEELFPGEVAFNWKDILANVLRPLQEAGFIEIRKKAKADTKSPQGRGGKAADVKPTPRFESDVAEPLLMQTLRIASRAEVRKLRSESLTDIWKQTASLDSNIRGNALERLSVRLCQMLALDFMGLRETDEGITAGGEVDAMMESARLIYSRWQVQCKTGNVVVGAVAKEVGMQSVTLANVILIISTGTITEGARKYREQIVRSTHLNIIFLAKGELQKVIANPTHLPVILREQARLALALKPRTGIKTTPYGASGETAEERPVVGEDAPEFGGPQKKSLTLPRASYETTLGRMFCGDALDLLPALIAEGFRTRLIITSPPFALIRKKEYGNEDSDSYVEWFAKFIPLFHELLTPNGSLVIDIGTSWIKGMPAKSTYHFKLLLRLTENRFFLAQDFYHYNPSRLPTPAEWVTIRRLRVKDAINHVWWLVKDPFIPVDNRRVLAPYSDSMKSLIKNGYKAAVRPSGHDISDKFQKDNGGAIPSNLLEFANTESNSHYIRRCREMGIKLHPARFPQALPSFFIRLLTDPGDLVCDPFAGSNVSGATAEGLGRRWIGTELSQKYVDGSKFRFESEGMEKSGGVIRRTKKTTKRGANDSTLLLPLTG